MYIYFSYAVYKGSITLAEYLILLASTTLFCSLLLGFLDKVALIERTLKAFDFYTEYENLLNKHSTQTKSNELQERIIDFGSAVIKFENVSFVYPNTTQMILININLTIRHGEKLAVVGLNGSGKTTFVKLLTRLYDPTEGRITLNGIDIKEIPYKQYTKYIGVVLQDFTLFAYTVRENVILDNKFFEEKFNESIIKSGLSSKIDSLEKGVDTFVYKTLDQSGVEFSGGEGQKLALARALYKDPNTLILDEPTSALDPLAEYEFFKKLNKSLKIRQLYLFHIDFLVQDFVKRLLFYQMERLPNMAIMMN